jgi:Flp pilus assembly protein TadD
MNRILTLLLIFATQFIPAVAQSPDVQAHVGKGYELEKDDRFAEAAAEFQAALAIDPNLPRARYQLAVCYFALARHDDARREFTRLRTETRNDPSVVYFLGRLDLVEHHPDAAIGELQSVVAKPPFPDTAYYLGSAYLEKGDLTSADRWFKKALPLNPRDFRIPDHLARIDQREGHSAEAEQQYTLASRLRENYNQAAQEGVDCTAALDKGATDSSQNACGKLNQPDDPDRLTSLGMIYGRHGLYAAAVEPLRRAAELDPDSYEIEHNLGLTYFRLKRYQDARGPLERAVALRPDFFDSNALLGATLFALQQDAEAYRVLDHAHKLNPQDADTRELLFKSATILGTENYQAKRYGEAVKFLQTAEELNPQDPQVHMRLSVVYAEAGDRQRADLEKQTAQRLAAGP